MQRRHEPCCRARSVHSYKREKLPGSLAVRIYFNLFRSVFPVFDRKEYEHRCGCYKSGQGSELGAFKSQGQRAVVSPEVFQEEAEKGIKHDVEAEGGTSGMFEAGVPEKQTQNDKISLAFPDFRRPQGLGAVGVVGQSGGGVEDAEVSPCGMTKSIAVHEIGNTADGLTENDGRCNNVSEWEHRNVPLFEKNIAGHTGENDASLNGHASLPYIGDFQQMVVVVIPVKKEHIPQPAADNAYEGDGEAQVKHAFMPAPAVLFQKIVGHDTAEYDA